jgi:hypothetical protein
MSFNDVINITRIHSLNDSELAGDEELSVALINMAERAEEKYNSGFFGVIRKIISFVLNIFTTDSVLLFRKSGKNNYFEIEHAEDKGQLPRFLGNNAEFARMVAEKV